MCQSNQSLVLPTVKESHILFEASILKIKCDDLQIGNSSPYPYYSLMTYPFSVAILAITPEGFYVLNEEYRHPTGRVLLGCPGGFVDPNENPLKAAERELMEETGFHARSYTVIGSAFPYAGISSQKTIYVRALGATLINQPALETSEIIRPILLKPEVLAQSIAAGTELDGTLCTALFFHQIQNQF